MLHDNFIFKKIKNLWTFIIYFRNAPSIAKAASFMPRDLSTCMDGRPSRAYCAAFKVKRIHYGETLNQTWDK